MHMSSKQIKRPVVITGGTGAIGACFAATLLDAGYPVAILGRGKTRPVQEAVDAILSGGHGSAKLRGYTCDVASEHDFEQTLDAITSDMGLPGALINAAGGNKGKADFVDMDVDTFEEVVRMNLIGGLVVPTKIMSKRWIEANVEGDIVNIASMASYLPLSGVWAYAASKAGVMNLTAGLAKEFASRGIRVNGIAPGFFVGNQNRDLLYADYEAGDLTPRGRQIIGHTPFGRFGKLEELNGTLLYLLDRRASGFVTGVTIPVDGGYLIDNI
jgi:NAD(P)-dependent dehydrogenase (short-subunit alcohol dehydrogenase family)